MPRIALYDHKADNVPQVFDYDWEELVSMLLTHERRTEKDGPLWSPVRIDGTRANKNVKSVTCAVFDVDSASREQLEKMSAALEGWEYVAHSTHSHTDENWKLRIVLRLSREVLPTEWPTVWRTLIEKFDIPADGQRKDLAGIYYLPAAVPGAEVIAERGKGQTVQVDDFLSRASPAPSTALKRHDRASPGEDLLETEKPLLADMDALRAAIADSSYGKSILRGDPIGDGRGANHGALKDTLNDLARVTLDFLPEAVLEVLQQGSFAHPEHYGTDPVEEFWLMFPGQRDYWAARREEQSAARAVVARFTQKRLTVRRDQGPLKGATPGNGKDARDESPDEGVSPSEDPDEPEEEERVFPLTDSGNAERLAHLYGNSFLCVSRQWFVWTGTRFSSETAESLLHECAKETVRSMPQEDQRAQDPEAIKYLNAWALKSESARARRDMLLLAQHEPEVRCSPAELDRDPFLLCLRNGTLELRSGELREHRKEDRITRVAGVEYRAGAECPLWDAFMLRAMGGDVELVGFLQRFAGYCLTGDVGEQVFLFLYGEGSNGKSTFCHTLRYMLGDYARFGAPDLLIAKHGDSHPTELADLKGARLVICQETEKGRALAETRVKQLTGGDKVTARVMRGDFFEFEPTHKLILAGNYKPKIRGTDHAMWRRVRLVPYAVRIPEGERDTRFPERLRAELPGILNWAVRGCLEWQRGGLRAPARVQVATEGYKRESDVIEDFLEDSCVAESGATALSSTLYSSYRRWAEGAGEHPMTQRAFVDELRSKGYEKKHTAKGKVWVDLRFRGPKDSHLKVIEREAAK